MSSSITLTRSDAATINGLVRMDLTITSANNIITTLFVKQRSINLDGSFNDSFITVANAADIEDYEVGSPGQDCSYFLDDQVSLVGNSDEIEAIFNEVTTLLATVCGEVDDLSSTTLSGTFTINSSGVV